MNKSKKVIFLIFILGVSVLPALAKAQQRFMVPLRNMVNTIQPSPTGGTDPVESRDLETIVPVPPSIDAQVDLQDFEGSGGSEAGARCCEQWCFLGTDGKSHCLKICRDC